MKKQEISINNSNKNYLQNDKFKDSSYCKRLQYHIRNILKENIRFMVKKALINDGCIDMDVLVYDKLPEDLYELFDIKIAEFEIKIIDKDALEYSELTCFLDVKFHENIETFYKDMVTSQLYNYLYFYFYVLKNGVKKKIAYFSTTIGDFISLMNKNKDEIALSTEISCPNIYLAILEEEMYDEEYNNKTQEIEKIKNLKEFFDNFVGKINSFKCDEEDFDSIDIEVNDVPELDLEAEYTYGRVKFICEAKNKEKFKILEFLFRFDFYFDDINEGIDFMKYKKSIVKLTIGDPKNDSYVKLPTKFCYNLATNIIMDDKIYLRTIKIMLRNILNGVEKNNKIGSQLNVKEFYNLYIF